MCSAYDSKDYFDQAIKNGMLGVLTKPIDNQALRKLLNKYYF